MNEFMLSNSLGHWYAEYKLPETLEVYKSTGEKLKEGLIVLSFKIVTTSTENGKEWTYLTYHDTSGKTNGQWDFENSDINSNKVKISFPETKVEGVIDISDGFYPVAVFSTRSLSRDIGGIY